MSIQENTENLRKVLIVDDESDSLEMTASLLAGEGYEVRKAQSGFEALDAVRTQRIDLVLLDVLMEGMDGFETLKRIREKQGDAHLPVILLTALNESHRDFGIDSGADDYLTKPYRVNDLLARVRVGLRLRKLNERLVRLKELNAGLYRFASELNCVRTIGELDEVIFENLSAALGCEKARLVLCTDGESGDTSVFSAFLNGAYICSELQLRQKALELCEKERDFAFGVVRCNDKPIAGVCVYPEPEDGFFEEAVSLVTAVFERFYLRHELAMEGRRLRHIVEGSADAFFFLTRDGMAQPLNDVCRELLELDEGQAEVHLSKVLSAEGLELLNDYLSKAFSNPTSTTDLPLSSGRTIRLSAALSAESRDRLQCLARDVTSETLKMSRLSRDNEILEKRLSLMSDEMAEKSSFENIIGRNSRMKEALSLVRKISNTTASVLITGETGTGKELMARAIHVNSPVCEGAFLRLDCSALSDAGLFATLFGESGSAHEGMLELAKDGTLFLEHIESLSAEAQARLANMLIEHRYTPEGSDEIRKLEARIIASSSENLKELVSAKDFREDLFYRLGVVQILLPPLRERCEDIPLLAQRFAKDAAEVHGKPAPVISDRANSTLMEQAWPGNVRELRSVVEQAVLFSSDGRIGPSDLKLSSTVRINRDTNSLKDALSQPEKEIVLGALEDCNWNCSKAARTLSVSRTTLYKKMKRYGIRSRRKSGAGNERTSGHGQ
ncbi:MAG: sigma-54-dependent Fis family transcriptional regulator [Planctomycetota bacterium]|nr:sigma-54-dependent Fis family transcriptional regulator [Planctomycetota bacterium]